MYAIRSYYASLKFSGIFTLFEKTAPKIIANAIVPIGINDDKKVANSATPKVSKSPYSFFMEQLYKKNL